MHNQMVLSAVKDIYMVGVVVMQVLRMQGPN